MRFYWRPLIVAHHLVRLYWNIFIGVLRNALDNFIISAPYYGALTKILVTLSTASAATGTLNLMRIIRFTPFGALHLF